MPSLKPQQVLEKQSFPGHVLTEEQMTQHAKVLKDQVVVVVSAPRVGELGTRQDGAAYIALRDRRVQALDLEKGSLSLPPSMGA